MREYVMNLLTVFTYLLDIKQRIVQSTNVQCKIGLKIHVDMYTYAKNFKLIV